ncbi:MAG: SAM-dependent methyltransferase [Gammaproteobacteria bacterium]|nr:SAM-dependent methyltransferase [Gammaproteobacteria bacterium]MCW8927739.1 SAM-dependent methyltransferase [Gammaproteobacteria bacterium]MCW8971746.1 SAM-dependent methyltransferase [Gammaproteobacteria bacterium]MCW8993349.1 SAM-dependent methyltransferase [Gammaproteobacteria bacterium]
MRRFHLLDALLDEHVRLWRPQPFKQERPAWCAELPELCATLLALTDAELARLTQDSAALNAVLNEHLPKLAQLSSLTALTELSAAELESPGPHFAAGIPGRKWQQITAFSAVLGEVRAPLLEWCGGKGHLGRLLALQWQQPVLTLEREQEFCEAGKEMAERAHVAQHFHTADVLDDAVEAYLSGRHAVALHACGELHRNLVRRAAALEMPALDIAPCCFHLYGDEQYQPFTPGARLELARDDLRLAVTETVTAVGREVRLRDREMAWKLGFEDMRRAQTGNPHYHPLRPIDKQWLKLGFAGFCHALAEREGLCLAGAIDWEYYAARGWQRQRETMRLSLLRHTFRRAIELWLVLDLACYLEANGYRVTLGTFCERELTPRNILLSARLRS